MCLNLELFFFRVSSLAYPNLLGKKGYVVVVVVGHATNFMYNPHQLHAYVSLLILSIT